MTPEFATSAREISEVVKALCNGVLEACENPDLTQDIARRHLRATSLAAAQFDEMLTLLNEQQADDEFVSIMWALSEAVDTAHAMISGKIAQSERGLPHSDE